MILSAAAFLTVIAFMIVGLWLEGIGGKHDGLIDHFLTPFPLGAAALMLVLFERL